jgi:uncharacterized protein YlxW (UPF0749 family)
MTVITRTNKMYKHIPAVLAALGMTLVVGIAMFALGLNALINNGGSQVKDAPALAQVSSSATVDQANLQKLQGLISQYQTRENQYQTELNQAAQKLDQANAQIQQDQAQLQQYESLLMALQNAGVIRITSDGRVLLPRSGFGGEFNDNN